MQDPAVLGINIGCGSTSADAPAMRPGVARAGALWHGAKNLSRAPAPASSARTSVLERTSGGLPRLHTDAEEARPVVVLTLGLLTVVAVLGLKALRP